VKRINRRDLFVTAGSLAAAFLARRAARAAASSERIPPAPVRVDFDAGHGIGSTRAQQDREAADTYAFLLWQTGVRAYQPT
jgi:prolyl oligopeptidase